MRGAMTRSTVACSSVAIVGSFTRRRSCKILLSASVFRIPIASHLLTKLWVQEERQAAVGFGGGGSMNHTRIGGHARETVWSLELPWILAGLARLPKTVRPADGEIGVQGLGRKSQHGG